MTEKVVLRPLITYDKHDIVRLAEKIDTFEISIQPFEDCCTLFVPERPSTKASVSELEQEELHLEIDNLVAQAIDGVEIIELR